MAAPWLEGAAVTVTVLTAEGRRALEEKRRSLYARRSAAIDEIASARQETDRSESAAYLQARTELSLVESQITETESILRDARDATLSGPTEAAQFGSWVVVSDESGEVEYHLVDPFAVDPRRGWISTQSPVGRALVGSRPGDLCVALTPSGSRTLRVRRVKQDPTE